jgi:hypothetical protein
VQSRLAEFIAAGEAPFPDGLQPDQADDLLAAVRRLRRDQLRRFIARHIALEIRRNDGPS